MNSFGLKELQEHFPEAYEQLMNHYKNDSRISFFVDNADGTLYCNHVFGKGKFRWWSEVNAWIEIRCHTEKKQKLI